VVGAGGCRASAAGRAGLLLRSFYEIAHVDAGFDPEQNVITMRVAPAPFKYGGHPDLQSQLARGILRDVSALPGVQKAGISTDVPLAGKSIFIMRFEGFPPVTPSQAPLAITSPSRRGTSKPWACIYCATRDFGSRQCGIAAGGGGESDACRSIFSGAESNRTALEIGFDDPPRWREIVGVVKDVHSAGLDQDTPVQVYTAYFQVRQCSEILRLWRAGPYPQKSGLRLGHL